MFIQRVGIGDQNGRGQLMFLQIFFNVMLRNIWNAKYPGSCIYNEPRLNFMVLKITGIS